MKSILELLGITANKTDPVQDAVTVVSGLPRSGTSMMMKMLEAGGVPPLTDEIREADRDNPKGYYEFERVKQLDKGDTAWLPQAQGKAVKIISALLQHLPAEYTYYVIFMRRNIEEILASQRRMLINRGEDPDSSDDEQMQQLYEKHLRQVEGWLAEQDNVHVLYVNYNELIEDPVPHCEQIDSFLPRALDVERMINVVDPSLYRQRQQ